MIRFYIGPDKRRWYDFEGGGTKRSGHVEHSVSSRYPLEYAAFEAQLEAAKNPVADIPALVEAVAVAVEQAGETEKPVETLETSE